MEPTTTPEPPRVWFWEESRNVQSMTRCAIAASVCMLAGITFTVCRVALGGKAEAPGIIAALAGFAAPIAAGMWAVARERHPEPTP